MTDSKYLTNRELLAEEIERTDDLCDQSILHEISDMANDYYQKKLINKGQREIAFFCMKKVLMSQIFKSVQTERAGSKSHLSESVNLRYDRGGFLIRYLYNNLLSVKKHPVEDRPYLVVKEISKIYSLDGEYIVRSVEETSKMILDLIQGKAVRVWNLVDAYNYKGKDVFGERYNGEYDDLQIDLGIEYTDELLKVIKFILKNNISTYSDDSDDIGQDFEGGFSHFFDYEFDDDEKAVTITDYSLNALGIDKSEFTKQHYLNMMRCEILGLDDDDDT